MPESTVSLEATLTEVEGRARAGIEAARTPDELEPVRIEVLGRKGTLAQISKQLGGLAPEDRARVGRLLNSVKQALEEALERKRLNSSRKPCVPAWTPNGSTLPCQPPVPGPARSIPSPRSRPRSRTSSFRSASPSWTGRRSKPNTTTSTL